MTELAFIRTYFLKAPEPYRSCIGRLLKAIDSRTRERDDARECAMKASRKLCTILGIIEDIDPKLARTVDDALAHKRGANESVEHWLKRVAAFDAAGPTR